MTREEQFDEHRALLFSIAYRMLGSVMDAEDVVQDAFLRWQGASDAEVESPKAYLSTIVTRLCLDHLRSARVQREQYVGPWLPEPLVTEQAPDAADPRRRRGGTLPARHPEQDAAGAGDAAHARERPAGPAELPRRTADRGAAVRHRGRSHPGAAPRRQSGEARASDRATRGWPGRAASP